MNARARVHRITCAVTLLAFAIVAVLRPVASAQSAFHWSENSSEGFVTAVFGEPETVSDVYFGCRTATRQFEVGVAAEHVRSLKGVAIRLTIDRSVFDLPVARQDQDEETVFLVSRVGPSSALLPALESARAITISFVGTRSLVHAQVGGANAEIDKAIDACA